MIHPRSHRHRPRTRCHCDHRRMPVETLPATQLRDRLVTVNVRHFAVHEHRRIGPLSTHLESFPAIDSNIDCQPERVQKSRSRRSTDLIVINYEHARIPFGLEGPTVGQSGRRLRGLRLSGTGRAGVRVRTRRGRV